MRIGNYKLSEGAIHHLVHVQSPGERARRARLGVVRFRYQRLRATVCCLKDPQARMPWLLPQCPWNLVLEFDHSRLPILAWPVLVFDAKTFGRIYTIAHPLPPSVAKSIQANLSKPVHRPSKIYPLGSSMHTVLIISYN